MATATQEIPGDQRLKELGLGLRELPPEFGLAEEFLELCRSLGPKVPWQHFPSEYPEHAARHKLEVLSSNEARGNATYRGVTDEHGRLIGIASAVHEYGIDTNKYVAEVGCALLSGYESPDAIAAVLEAICSITPAAVNKAAKEYRWIPTFSNFVFVTWCQPGIELEAAEMAGFTRRTPPARTTDGGTEKRYLTRSMSTRKKPVSG